MVLAEPEADAANVSTAFFELFDLWSEAFEAASFELGLEFWGAGGHDDGFAGADEIAGEAFDTLGWVDEDFVEVGNRFEFGAGDFVEGVWAVGDSVFVDDAEGEIEIIEEAVGVVGFWVDEFAAVRVGFRLGVELNEIESEGLGDELLSFWIGAVAGASEKIIAAD